MEYADIETIPQNNGKYWLEHKAEICKYVFMRTTIDLPDPLFRRVKAAAAMEGTSLKELITRFVEQGLLKGVSELREGRPTRSKPPVIRPAGGASIPALSNADIERLLAEEEVERVGRE